MMGGAPWWLKVLKSLLHSWCPRKSTTKSHLVQDPVHLFEREWISRPHELVSELLLRTTQWEVYTQIMFSGCLYIRPMSSQPASFAENEEDQSLSDPVHLFEREWISRPHDCVCYCSGDKWEVYIRSCFLVVCPYVPCPPSFAQTHK